jgi:hypothetical protein
MLELLKEEGDEEALMDFFVGALGLHIAQWVLKM